MKRNKIICLIFCFIFAFLLFTGCGSENNTVSSSLSSEAETTVSKEEPELITESSSQPVLETSSEPVSSSAPKQEPEPEETIDPSSTLLPDIEEFLYWSASTSKRYNDFGYLKQWNGSHPYAAYETIQQELLDLLLKERYQLELKEAVQNPHYGIPVYDYYFNYTGTFEGIETLTDKYEEHQFNAALSFYLYPDEGYFKIQWIFSNSFKTEDPESRTTRNMDPDGDGGILTTPPENNSDDDDFWEKCSACHGSKKCTHCNGKGEVEKFQAGLGWVDQDCTLCNRGKCRYCDGTGKD